MTKHFKRYGTPKAFGRMLIGIDTDEVPISKPSHSLFRDQLRKQQWDY